MRFRISAYRFGKRLAMIISAGLVLAVATSAQAQDGKQIFQDQKCNWCHSVKDVGIDRPEDKQDKKAGPDLSGVGSKYDSTWLEAWLAKKARRRSVMTDRDVYHRKQFKGPNSDLTALIRFLGQLKQRSGP